MRKPFKLTCRVLVVLAAIALAPSLADAQISRTFTLSCNNLPGVGAQITSWEWITDVGATVATVVTTGWNCANGGFFTVTLDQPGGGDAGFTAGVKYSLAFTGASPPPGCTDISDFVKPGQPVHFHDRCRYTAAGAPKNAVTVAVLGR